MKATWERWVDGLFNAILGAAATAVVAMGVSPETFMQPGGGKKIALVAVVSGGIAGVNYFRQSPLPIAPGDPRASFFNS